MSELESLIKQRDLLDKLINELTTRDCNSNFPIHSNFLTIIKIPDLNYDKTNLLDIKLFINKKFNQISNDLSHVDSLIDEFNEYTNKKSFNQIFALKMAEQGKNLVEVHLDSYIPLSYILYKLDTSVIDNFKYVCLTKNVSKGTYAIYFGYLKFKNLINEMWFFLSSVLNVKPDSNTSYILEVFFVINLEVLYKVFPIRIRKIERYLNAYFYKEISNEPVIVRIKDIFNKLS